LALGSVLNEKEKDRATKLWLIWLGAFMIIGAVLAAIF
jgi:hypothetical protein